MSTRAANPMFVGRSEMHRRVNELDWSATSVGPVENWPQSLRATIKTLLGSRYPMILLWGPDLIQIYNEAYIGLIGDKHPGALGRSIRETQAESWDIIGPMIHEVMSSGVPNWVPAQMLPLERAGYREESYFSLSYSAVDDDEGRIMGMLCVCSEMTQQVLGERRTRFLRDLALKAGEIRSVETTCRDIASAMSEQSLDVPFALLYLREGRSESLTLRGAVGIEVGTAASPGAVELREAATAPWPLDRALKGETVLVEDIEPGLGLSGGPWGDAVRSALVLPIPSADPAILGGVLVAGVSPNRALDEGYSSFYDLLLGQVSLALRNARAYEDERRRAEALAELDRAKTAFFSNVSHEFRTPLTLMLGPLEDLLCSKSLSTDLRQELEVVHRNAGRLLRLVNALLDFSRLEAGRLQASFQPTNVAALTADLASGFRSAIERAGLTLSVECDRGSANAFVDREMWEKVVLNLLSNALKFTFSGGITVRVREHADELKLEVADTGTGIPAAELPHVFERFHRVKGAQSRTYEGSGIGLALVRELIELHGGSVQVSSAEGRGTTFVVTLPLGDAHLPRERGATQKALASTSTSRRAFADEALRWLPEAAAVERRVGSDSTSGGPRGRILVADDNADMREYLARVLGSSFDVVTVPDGEAALNAVQTLGSFDLVLTDVMMPRLGGFGLLKALRADARTSALPVIMLSARAGEEASVEGLEAGADDYLVKPFSARELVARTRTTLELARMRRELTSHEAREKGLLESVRARDEFLSIASHELKTPLTPLQVQIQSLERHVLQIARGERSAEWLGQRLDVLKRQGKRLERLVNELLDVTKLMGDELRLDVESVSLNEVVRDVLSRFEDMGLLARSGCAVEVSTDDDVVGLWDRSRLDLLVANLIENALKFGAGRPVEVTLRKSGSVATLSVTDHGIGIAPEDQVRIFGRFERAVSERHYGGLGLGLWIVHQVVEALGGSVKVDSKLGHGATLIVRLPLEAPSVAREQKLSGESPPAAAALETRK